MIKRLISLAALLVLLMGRLSADTFSGYQLAQEGAWCWFADPRATHYRNAAGTIDCSYVGYIDVHGNIKATQVDWLTGVKSDVLVRSYFQPDDHNNPTFLVLPDERVLIIYSRHTDERAFYYRVSRRPGDITQLGEEHRLATQNNTTYPSPFIMSDDPTHWYLCWRGISWHPTIARLTLPDADDNVSFDWGPYQMVQSTGARPYAKYYSNGKDKLYVTYTTGHPDNESPNWVYFNVININGGGEPTLEDIQGNTLSTIKNGAFNVNKTADYKTKYPATVVDAPANGLRDWVWQIALDADEHPCIAMVRISSDKGQHEYYYAKWTGTAWRLTDLADGGGKFHLSNTEKCYSAGEALDQQDPHIIYLSLPTDGDNGRVYEIWKYTLADDGTITDKEQLTRNSLKNNVRPFVLPNSVGSPMRLVWMSGDYYYWIVCKNYPFGYPTRIMCDTPLPTPTPQADGWTVSQDITMDADAYTNKTLLTAGDITYGIDADAYPYIIIGETTYRSTSKLYTSDAWQTCPATTDGKSYAAKLTTWRLTLTYADGTLTVYRNGMIDQRLTGLTLTRPAAATDGCLTQEGVEASLVASKDAFENGDFEASYAAMPWSGVTSDRAINVPEGWTVSYPTRDVNDLTCLQTGDQYYSNFFAAKPAAPNGGGHTFWVRQRWAASVLDFSQNVQLPEGSYTLTAQVYATATGGANVAKVYVGDAVKQPTAANEWQTLSFAFTSDGLTPTRIGYQAQHAANEFICGFDNFNLAQDPSTGVQNATCNMQNAPEYDLAGRPATARTRGVVVSEGRKRLQK